MSLPEFDSGFEKDLIGLAFFRPFILGAVAFGRPKKTDDIFVLSQMPF